MIQKKAGQSSLSKLPSEEEWYQNIENDAQTANSSIVCVFLNG